MIDRHSSGYSNVIFSEWKNIVGCGVAITAVCVLVCVIVRRIFSQGPSDGNQPRLNGEMIVVSSSSSSSTDSESSSTGCRAESNDLFQITLPLSPEKPGEIPHLKQPLDWTSVAIMRRPIIATRTGGVSASIGMHASLLLSGGNALYHALLETAPECVFLDVKPDKIEVCFKDRDYARRLFDVLKGFIELDCKWEEIDIIPAGKTVNYYHAAISFTDAASFVFFARYLCSQPSQDLLNFIRPNQDRFLHSPSPFWGDVHSANQGFTSLETVERTDNIIIDDKILIPPEIREKGVSQVIGAVTALLFRGGTLYEEILTLQGLVYVELEKDGLSLHFPHIVRGGKVTKNGLSHCGHTQKALGKKGLPFGLIPSDFKNRGKTYKGCLFSADSKVIVAYLMRFCQLSKEGIQEWIEGEKMESTVLGQQILQGAREGASNYTVNVDEQNQPESFSLHEECQKNYVLWRAKAERITVQDKIIIPPKIRAKGVSQIIGAVTALLLPGWTSYQKVLSLQELVYVELNKNGLSLYFPHLTNQAGRVLKDGTSHCQKTRKALQEIGIIFYSSLSELTNEHGRYEGSLFSSRPMVIVAYLMRICQLSRKDVQDWIKARGMESTELGQQILQISQWKMEGEDNYDAKILMNEEDSTPIGQLSINCKKFHFEPIPDLPSCVKNLDVREMLKEKFNGVKDQAALIGDGHDSQTLERGIDRMLEVLSGGLFSGMPRDTSDRYALVERLKFVLKHIFFLLPVAVAQEPEANMEAICISQLAIGGLACAAGHVQAIFSVYQTLSRFRPSGVSCQGNSNLALVDLQLIEIIDKELTILRSSIFNILAAQYGEKYKGDPAHFKVKMLQAIGRQRAIPGAELANYKDPYAGTAPDLTDQTILSDFDARYCPAKIVEHLQERFKFGCPEIGSFVDFIIRHAPPAFQEGDEQSEFMWEVLKEDCKTLKKTYLRQILVISGHFSYYPYQPQTPLSQLP